MLHIAAYYYEYMACESAHTCGGLVSEVLQLHEGGVGQFIQLQVFRRHEES